VPRALRASGTTPIKPSPARIEARMDNKTSRSADKMPCGTRQ
jgi:hypothetical protein